MVGCCLSKGALTIGHLRPGGPRRRGASSGFLPGCPAVLHRQERRDGEQELQPQERGPRGAPAAPQQPRKADMDMGWHRGCARAQLGAYLLGATSAQLPPPTRGDRGVVAFAYQTQLQHWQTWQCSELKGSPSSDPSGQCSSYSPRADPLSLRGEGALPHLPPLPVFAQKGKTRGWRRKEIFQSFRSFLISLPPLGSVSSLVTCLLQGDLKFWKI